MESELVKKLATKVRNYESELESMVSQRKEIDRKIEEAQEYLEHYRAVYAKESGTTLPESDMGTTRKKTVAEAAELVLREAGKHLKASYIAKVILERELAQLSEKHGTSVVISTMRRFPGKFKAEGNGYYNLIK